MQFFGANAKQNNKQTNKIQYRNICTINRLLNIEFNGRFTCVININVDSHTNTHTFTQQKQNKPKSTFIS